jgi:uncharacterized protein
MTSFELATTALVAVLIVIGVVGTIVPILPGLGLIWVAMLGYGIALGFGVPGWIAMAIASALVVLGLYLNVRIPQRSAAGTGLSVRAQLVAVGLAVVGFFTFPPFGVPIGFVGGVYLMRLQATGDRSQAWSSTKTIVGALIRASIAQFACAVAMFLVWAGWAVALAFGTPS